MASDQIEAHYASDGIVDRVRAGLQAARIAIADVSVDDLGPVDEFHTGGRAATEHLLGHLEIDARMRVLDIGCGIGGTSRFLADRFGVTVSGIDLTQAYVDAGATLNRWVGLDERIALRCGDARHTAFDDASFDLAVMLHVGMNIEDKAALFREAARLLRSGGTLAIYDVMRTSEAALTFPLPWATDPSMSFVEPLSHYERCLDAAGFTIETSVGRGEFARAFFQGMQEAARRAAAPPPVGLHLLVGPTVKVKMAHFAGAVFDGAVEPTELVARRR